MSSEARESTKPHFVVTMEGDIHGEDTPENREIVRRIHACWNACEGITTEELEKEIIQDMRHVISTMIPVLQQTGAGSGTIKKPNIMKESRQRADSRMDDSF